jgi:peptidyl-prolyl cis-trans isomerase SurA
MFGVRCFYQALLCVLFGCVAVTPVAAQTQINNLGSTRPNASAPQRATSASSNQEADAIVAVVNKDVITRRELDLRIQQIKTDLTRQRAQLPPDEILQSQLLQRLIIERLQVQEAKRLNIEVTDQVLKTALDAIAQRNNMSPAQLRSQIEGAGVPWADYSGMIRREVLVDRLRQRVVDSTILITDAEVDAFLREQKARQSGGLLSTAPAKVVTAPPPPPPKPKAAPIQPAVMGIAQILVRVPEDSSEEEVKVLRAKAQALLARLRKGESFEAVAKSSSDGPEASRGGDMGGRLVADWPDLFLKAVAGVGDGQISNIIQSGNGFHILKVLGRAGGAPPPEPVAQPEPPKPGAGVPAAQGPMMVEQTRARHILIKTTTAVPSDVAKQKLDQVRERIVNGKESFSDLAKRFSNDSSAPQGGGLGWLNPGETVPPFEQAMKKLKIGEVSEPVQTTFGWHLIVVDERRTQDMAEQFQRNQVRQRLFAQRSEASFEAWLQSLRNQSYIDNRLEKSQRQAKD